MSERLSGLAYLKIGQLQLALNMSFTRDAGELEAGLVKTTLRGSRLRVLMQSTTHGMITYDVRIGDSREEAEEHQELSDRIRGIAGELGLATHRWYDPKGSVFLGCSAEFENDCEFEQFQNQYLSQVYVLEQQYFDRTPVQGAQTL